MKLAQVITALEENYQGTLLMQTEIEIIDGLPWPHFHNRQLFKGTVKELIAKYHQEKNFGTGYASDWNVFSYTHVTNNEDTTTPWHDFPIKIIVK